MEAELDLLKLQMQYPNAFADGAATVSAHQGREPLPPTANPDLHMEWTDDAIKLLELALSVHRARSINHGKATIKAVVDLFFGLFGLKPGNFSATYGVMRIRGNRTQYLDELKAGLEEKMDEDDERQENRRNEERKGRR